MSYTLSTHFSARSTPTPLVPWFLSINKEIIKPSTSNVFKRDFSSFEENMYIDDVSIQNWNNNLHDTNSKEIKKMKNPWIINNILKLISHRDRLSHKIKKNPSNNHTKSAYKLL